MIFFFSAQLTQRTGTTHDWRRLKFTFENLGFEVVIHHNLMSFDIRGEIKKIAAQNFSKYGCLVVCLLSHGIENAIAGADSIYVNVNKLKYKFSYNNCPSLYGKPKIFLVQACQGDLEQNQKNIVPLTLLSAGTIFFLLNSNSPIFLYLNYIYFPSEYIEENNSFSFR